MKAELHLCDLCLLMAERREGDPITIIMGGETTAIDLCKSHATPLTEFIKTVIPALNSAHMPPQEQLKTDEVGIQAAREKRRLRELKQQVK